MLVRQNVGRLHPQNVLVGPGVELSLVRALAVVVGADRERSGWSGEVWVRGVVAREMSEVDRRRCGLLKANQHAL